MTENNYRIAAQNAGIDPDDFEAKVREEYVGKPLHPGVEAALYGKNVRNFKGGVKLSGYWTFLISKLPE